MADPKQTTKTTETHTTITQTQGNLGNPPSAPTGSAPVTNTLNANRISATTTRLEGEVTPNKASTLYWFEYGSTPNLGGMTAPLSAGEGGDIVPVSAIVSDLEHTATHYFRLVAENKHGKVVGAVHALHAAEVKKEVAAATEPSLLYNVLATAGLIVVLIVVIWGLFHLATLLSPWFSSLFKSSQTPAALHVSAPASAVSGTPFTVSWSYNTSAKGTYAFLYPCNDSLRFDTAGAQGASNAIPCGAAFSVTGTSLKVTPALSGTKALNEQLTVIFVPQSGAQVQGSAVVAINPGVTQPAATVPVVQKPVAVAHTGPADLSVQILSAAVDQSGLATVVFDIANNGSGDSGSYTFQAYLPTQSTYTYYSDAQLSLAPGSHVVNTLRFTQAAPGAISIIVDPTNGVNDSNRTNNYAAQSLSMPYLPAQAGGYNPQQQYYSNQPTPIYYGQPYVY